MRSALTCLIAAIALVVLVVLFVSVTGQHHGTRSRSAEGASDAAAPAPVTVPMPSTTAAPIPQPWATISDEATSEADYLARLSDPARSDLEPGLARTLAQLAAVVVRADLSGVGREEFPRYWAAPDPAADSSPCCSQVTIDAAGAASVPGHPSLARVAVVWSALRGTQHLVRRTSVVYFQRTSGSWEPRRPWDLHG